MERRPSVRGPYARSAGTRARALRAARRAVADPGASTTLRALAAAAGLTDSGLLHHFGSRDGLLVATAAADRRADTDDDAAEASLLRELVRIACDRTSPARSEALDVLARERAGGGRERLGVILDRALRASGRRDPEER
ncbi:hypothetical protein DEJ23_06885 [Curtobacterium sp. MCSS17_008]|uniref:TetR family transcriptional regulator n=1 Tax=Curtobacterium sp. MCSS17_008 TaxID=2175647 RepID=UPI000DA9BB90|nr:TetR family transcriptional regulator [Curtobacterium sp. MCSS17_008]PZF57853.1 hypothetical protein DEJ23_06885 [Curtobacterium sp. MCSS17_008]